MQGISVGNTSECNKVSNSNTFAASGIESLSARSETYIDTSQYNELSSARFTDISQQVAANFIKELDEYISFRKTPEKIRFPLVFRSISDPFAKQWMLTAYGQLSSYDDFKRTFTELLGDITRQSEIRCRVYQDCYDYRSGESFSEHYIRYDNMASMLSPAMSDQDLLGSTVTHYEPRIQACLISVNVKSNQGALAVLTKLQSLENSKEPYRPSRRDFDHQPRGPPSDSAGNRRPNSSLQVCHVRRDNRQKSTGQSVEGSTNK